MLLLSVSYYITAMPHFKSLNKCAQSGIASAVMEVSLKVPIRHHVSDKSVAKLLAMWRRSSRAGFMHLHKIRDVKDHL